MCHYLGIEGYLSRYEMLPSFSFVSKYYKKLDKSEYIITKIWKFSYD